MSSLTLCRVTLLTLGRPVRLSASTETHCVAEKRDDTGARLFPEITNLQSRLKGLTTVASPDTSSTQKSKERLRELTALRNVAGLLSGDFKKDVSFAREVENFTYRVLKGIDNITKALDESKCPRTNDGSKQPTKTPLSLIHILLQHRKSQDNELQLALESAAALDSKKRQSVLWSSKFLATTTRLVLRALNPDYSETGDFKRESELRKKERIPNTIISIIDRILPKKGGEALLIYCALEGTSQDRFMNLI